MLEMVGCDGTGLLMLAPYNSGGPNLVLGSRKKLGADTRAALVDTLYDTLAEHLRPPRGTLDLVDLSEVEPGIEPQTHWGHFQTTLLLAHEQPIGVAILASYGEDAPSDEALGLFHFLVTQASIALENARLFARANELATRDGVTGLYNHRHFFELLEAEISRAERHNQELAVIMLDIDHEGGLKMVNDTYGHMAGDDLLRQVSAFLLQSVRRADVVARYGGDEFIVLAPQTAPRHAQALAERICSRLAETSFRVAGHVAHVTASVGVAYYRVGHSGGADSVVSAADRELYVAKSSGGNRVCVAQEDLLAVP
jgi:diguanylate cyclase (GGDEF)-like protein